MYFEGCSPSEAKRLIKDGVYGPSQDHAANYLQNRESDHFSNPMYSHINTNTYSKYHRGHE